MDRNDCLPCQKIESPTMHIIYILPPTFKYINFWATVHLLLTSLLSYLQTCVFVGKSLLLFLSESKRNLILFCLPWQTWTCRSFKMSMQWLYTVLKLARKLCINLEFKTTQLYAIKLHTCAGISSMELIMQVLADKTAIFLEQFWYMFIFLLILMQNFFFSFDNVYIVSSTTYMNDD